MNLKRYLDRVGFVGQPKADLATLRKPDLSRVVSVEKLRECVDVFRWHGAANHDGGHMILLWDHYVLKVTKLAPQSLCLGIRRVVLAIDREHWEIDFL